MSFTLLPKQAASEDWQPALTRPEGGAFLAFVLLEAPAWDPDQFRRDLRDLYGIPCLTEAEESEDGGSTLTFEVSGMLAAVCLYPFPVPHGEAEENAAHNYLWPEAAESAARHRWLNPEFSCRASRRTIRAARFSSA